MRLVVAEPLIERGSDVGHVPFSYHHGCDVGPAHGPFPRLLEDLLDCQRHLQIGKPLDNSDVARIPTVLERAESVLKWPVARF